MSIRFVPHVSTVPFEELAGSPEERATIAWAGDGATRKRKCLSIHRIALEREMLGYIVAQGSIGIAGAPNAIIHLPEPFGIDRPNLMATNVVAKPLGRVSGVNTDTRYANYKHSILDVTYEVATRIMSERYGYVTLTEEIRDLTEFVTQPTKNLFWGTGGGKEAIDTFDAPGKMNYGLEWIYTISGAWRVPPQIFDYVGMINTVAIPKGDLGQVFMPYTLLYAEPVVAKEMTFGGAIYRITLRFLHKDNGTSASPKGWNWFPRISAAGAAITYEPITDGADAKNFYNSADFRDVFA